MKRFTLIIDGHNFFYRSLWSTFKQGGKRKVLVTQKDMDSYEKKLMIDFCSVIKQLNPIINDVVFVRDSHSWRKDLLLQQEYKGNRKKIQDDIDKNGFNTITGNFVETLKSIGVKVSCVERSEGDDLIYAWSEYLFNEGKSSLLLSTDRDLNQLVKCVNDVHIIQYGPVNNKLWVSASSYEKIQKLNDRKDISQENLFGEYFSVSIENDPFERFVETTNIEVVDPEVTLLTISILYITRQELKPPGPKAWDRRLWRRYTTVSKRNWDVSLIIISTIRKTLSSFFAMSYMMWRR